jgi:arylformamidase
MNTDKAGATSSWQRQKRASISWSAGALMSAWLIASPAIAQMPAPAGPVVWGGYTQNQLDAAYDQGFWDNDPPEASLRTSLASDAVRARYGAPERIAYGPSQYERLDLYRTHARGKRPIMVYIHGGAWRGGSAQTNASQAEMLIEAGAHFITLDFVNTLQNGGSIMEMAQQVRRAVAWTYQNAHKFGGDRRELYISGHSSGGHLCGVVMTTDWSQYGLPRDTVAGGLCSDGMYELYPVSLSARNTYANFTPETIELLSPQRQLRFLNAPLIIARGTKESPEFIRQSEDFYTAVKAAGKKVKLVVGTGYNHFEFPETYANPYGPLGRATLDLMGLVPNGANANGHDRNND